MSISAIERLREKARRCRRLAFRMQPSFGRSHLERLAARWDVMAQAEQRNATPLAANEP
jgi:hypothetical protein